MEQANFNVLQKVKYIEEYDWEGNVPHWLGADMRQVRLCQAVVEGMPAGFAHAELPSGRKICVQLFTLDDRIVSNFITKESEKLTGEEATLILAVYSYNLRMDIEKTDNAIDDFQDVLDTARENLPSKIFMKFLD